MLCNVLSGLDSVGKIKWGGCQFSSRPTVPTVIPITYTDASGGGGELPKPCSPFLMGELFIKLGVGLDEAGNSTTTWSLLDTGSGVTVAFSKECTDETGQTCLSGGSSWTSQGAYSSMSTQAAEVLPNLPLTLNCTYVLPEECGSGDGSRTGVYIRDDKFILNFGTGWLKYSPQENVLLLAAKPTGLLVNCMYFAVGSSRGSFPLQIPAILGVSHFKYSPGSGLGPLCPDQPVMLLNTASSMHRILSSIGGGECLPENQAFSIATFTDTSGVIQGELTLCPIRPLSDIVLDMVPGTLPFYTLRLLQIRVGSLVSVLSRHLVILDTGTSGGGSWSYEFGQILGRDIARYTGGATGMGADVGDDDSLSQTVLDLSEFPPIALMLGSGGKTFEIVLYPEEYMVHIGSNPDKKSGGMGRVNAFQAAQIPPAISPGSDTKSVISVAGNLVLNNMRITYDLFSDSIAFGCLDSSGKTVTPRAIESTYPDPPPLGTLRSSRQGLGEVGATVRVPPPRSSISPSVLNGLSQQTFLAALSPPIISASVGGGKETASECCTVGVSGGVEDGVVLIRTDSRSEGNDGSGSVVCESIWKSLTISFAVLGGLLILAVLVVCLVAKKKN
jgi:hypothetical protein